MKNVWHIFLAVFFSIFLIHSGMAADERGHMMPGMSGQMGHQMMQNGDMGQMSEASREYVKAMDSMHGSMMRGILDSDPDRAFVKGMLPHHQGAVEMARIQLKYGKDPELRKLAQDIIFAQEKEIEFMKKWLETHGRDK